MRDIRTIKTGKMGDIKPPLIPSLFLFISLFLFALPEVSGECCLGCPPGRPI